MFVVFVNVLFIVKREIGSKTFGNVVCMHQRKLLFIKRKQNSKRHGDFITYYTHEYVYLQM